MKKKQKKKTIYINSTNRDTLDFYVSAAVLFLISFSVNNFLALLSLANWNKKKIILISLFQLQDNKNKNCNWCKFTLFMKTEVVFFLHSETQAYFNLWFNTKIDAFNVFCFLFWKETEGKFYFCLKNWHSFSHSHYQLNKQCNEII